MKGTRVRRVLTVKRVKVQVQDRRRAAHEALRRVVNFGSRCPKFGIDRGEQREFRVECLWRHDEGTHTEEDGEEEDDVAVGPPERHRAPEDEHCAQKHKVGRWIRKDARNGSVPRTLC